jgi:hypothetical protein
MGQSEAMPTLRQLRDLGRTDLAKAIVAHGGVVIWAERVGLGLGAGQDRRPYGDREAVRDIRLVLVEHGRLPATDALRRLGYARLASYVQKRGGSRRVCAALRDQLFSAAGD